MYCLKSVDWLVFNQKLFGTTRPQGLPHGGNKNGLKISLPDFLVQ
jgi:hypothetical protein